MVTSQTLELIFNQLLLYITENFIYNWQGGGEGGGEEKT